MIYLNKSQLSFLFVNLPFLSIDILRNRYQDVFRYRSLPLMIVVLVVLVVVFLFNRRTNEKYPRKQITHRYLSFVVAKFSEIKNVFFSFSCAVVVFDRFRIYLCVRLFTCAFLLPHLSLSLCRYYCIGLSLFARCFSCLFINSMFSILNIYIRRSRAKFGN